MLHRPNKTRAAKEGVIEPSAADLIRPFVAGPDEPPRYALHFGTVDKVGVNPTSKYNTPLAVCAYPLTEEIFYQFLRIDLPFAQKDAKYLFVLEIKPDARVFYSTERFFDLGVGPEYLGADLSKIEVNAADDPTKAEIQEASFSKKFFYSTRPSGYYKSKQYFVKGGTAARAAQWGHKLWKMGIDVWVDADREGILHRSEPSQVMFFSPSSYRVALSMDNPKSTYQARFGRDWLKRHDIDVSPLERARAGDKNLRDANLLEADLTYADLRGADLRGADLRGANLTGAVLTSAKLNGADLTGAVLTSAKLNGADLTGADLKFTDLRYAQYDDSTIWPEGVRDVLRVWRGDKDLRGANLRDSYLRHAPLTGADLRGAYLRGAYLIGAYLTDADLTDADLIDADLIDAILSYAKLNGAKLNGAKLNDAKLNGAHLRDVRYDESTIWPKSVLDVLRVWRGDKDLRDANLTGANLFGANLTGANLEKASLVYANLTGANLTGANLTGANLTGANLTGAGLTGADLTGADLTGADLQDVRYDDSTIWPEDVRDVLRVWRGDKDLRGADLRDAILRGADLYNAVLSRAVLSDADLTRAYLRDADLTRAYLRGAKLNGADLTGADLKFTDLRYVQYDESTIWPDNARDVLRVWRGDKDLRDADLRDADLRGANLREADLTGADLTGADLIGADLIGAKLQDIQYDDSTIWPEGVRDVLRVWRGDKDLRGANLRGANLRGANLLRANLTGADLSRADLFRAKLTGAILDGIIYDDSTIWPSGFTPPPSAPRPNRR